jgi:hypothetical protein
LIGGGKELYHVPYFLNGDSISDQCSDWQSSRR